MLGTFRGVVSEKRAKKDADGINFVKFTAREGHEFESFEFWVQDELYATVPDPGEQVQVTAQVYQKAEAFSGKNGPYVKTVTKLRLAEVQIGKAKATPSATAA